MASKKDQTIIIRRVEEGEDHAHHGGGWKVAYADFMTAMMAFFLLLWILAASDEEMRRGLADYFTPSLSERGGRGDGFLDGTVLGEEGVLGGADGEAAPVQIPTFGQENPLALFDSRLRDADADPAVAPEQKVDSAVLSDAIEDAAEAMAALEAERARETWEATQEQLEQQISDEIASTAGLETLAEHIRFERRQDGLEIQIVDKTGQSMFSSGSARILDRTRKLLQVVAEALADLPNALTITGHTDSRRYAGDGYSNWELSADRANATRRALVENGVNPSRIMRISGLADTAPLAGLRPDADENRRIGIMVLYPR